MMNRSTTEIIHMSLVNISFLRESVWGKYEDMKMICLAQAHAEETK